jgi:hypothetical protein
MSYTQWKDGYAIETSFKDGTTINDAGDTAYLLGAISEESDWPSPEFEARYIPVGVNAREVSAGEIFKSQATLRGMLGITLQNGIPLWLAMGKSSTAGEDPYTHTITPTTDGSLLPSIVIQHEEKGTATNEEYQFQGVKVDSLMLSHDMSQNGPNVLMAKLEIMAGKTIDPGFALTNDPALPATANISPYTALTRTWDYGSGNTAITGLTKIEFHIINGLQPLYAHSWDTGVYTGHWPYGFIESPRKTYIIDLQVAKNTIERAVWDELLLLSNTKEAYFKWTRSANDYIAITCTDCQVTTHDIKTPAGASREDRVNIQLVPRAVSIEVKDSIAGGAYGE